MKSTGQEITDKLQVIQHQKQRVLTTSQLAESYGTNNRRISENFIRNENRFKEGKHFYSLQGQGKHDFLNHTQIADGSKNAQILYLWTEKGAWLHAKSLNTDKAWDAYEMLVDDYYNIKTQSLTTNSVIQEIQNNPEVINFLAEQVAKINAANNEFYDKASEKLETIDKKIEGEYVTPQDLDAINYAIKFKAEKFVDEAGIQITIDSVLVGDIYEQAQASKKEKEQRKYTVGKVKRQILVAVKKHLGMKGNAPNNHIKRKDVDVAIQFIKQVKQRELV